MHYCHFYRQACAHRSHAGIAFFSRGINVELARPLPRTKFHVYRDRNMGIQPSKLSKLGIVPINLPLRGNSFAQFLRYSQRLYASILMFNLVAFGDKQLSYKHCPSGGHFPANFQ